MFRKRYVATAVLIFVIGVVFGIFMNEYDDLLFRSAFIVGAALSVILFLLFKIEKEHKWVRIIRATAFAVAFFSLGVVYLSFRNSSFEKMKIYDGHQDKAIFEIIEVNSNSLDARVIKSEIGLAKGEIVRVYLDNIKEDLIVGDSFTADVKYNYTGTNQHRAGDISLSANGTADEYNRGDGIFYNIRKQIVENCQILFDSFKYSPAISKAVIVGDRSDLDSYIFTIYKTSGISHILAISGLHISIITMSVFNILSNTRMGLKLSSFGAVFVCIAYTVLVGFIPGAVRSAMMMTIMLILQAFFRNSDRFTTLSISLFVLLIENPYSILSAGLQLSFLCTLGIIMFAPLIYRCSTMFESKLIRAKGLMFITYKVISSALSSVITATAASLFSFPILCMSFDTVSYISPLVNIVAVPLFTYAVILTFLALMVSLISCNLAMIFAYPAGFLYETVTLISRIFFDADVGTTSVHSDIMIIPLLMSFAFIAITLLKPTYRLKRYIIFAIVFTISISVGAIYNSNLNNNKAILEYNAFREKYIYMSYENKGIYVDVGGYTSSPDAVFKNGLTEIETYIMLDYSSYSLSRLDYFTANVKVNKLVLPKYDSSFDVTLLSQIKELANERNCDILFYTDSYSEDISEDSYIEILSDNHTSEETMICVNLLGQKIRFLGKGFDDTVICDIAVAMDGYSYIEESVYADRLYIPFDYEGIDEIDVKARNFDECLKFKFNISERDYEIYES